MKRELRGTKINPYHLSVGAIIQDGSRYALIKNANGIYRLPSETMYGDESIEAALLRGMAEELGVIVECQSFLGSANREFSRPNVPIVKKTTIYFLCTKTGETTRSPEADEVDDEILWVTKDVLYGYLQDSALGEEVLLERF